MQISAQGVATLKHHEGEVLRAYRCPAGIWTIGVGLTAASGVVKPKAGMTITSAESTSLLQQALRRNYEPAVKAAMPGAKQHEFDAGGNFHFNTGAIGRATWVKQWRTKAAAAVIRAGMLVWNKGGGKVLPGLVRRREDEARMLLEGKYPVSARNAAPEKPKPGGSPVWALAMSGPERIRVEEAFNALGYGGGMLFATDVQNFQRDHGLTIDGIIGRATLSTLQRRIDAAAKAKPAAAAPVIAAAAPATGAGETLALPPSADWLILGLAVAYGLWVAFRYRDAIAAHLTHSAPRAAAFLRSF
ncbi:MAG: peptidoglycan-binding protein [Pseudotabrizicola sp.]|uniref:glycoside hydrolase family protein n=1 Tax=Pseudotabrizicola sp. TaxID=2939647 RepID=UPI0027286A0F|nr:peptidoglycan-binding protein [Pseudotabrizicola sp.]MDO9639668.1 peptidoglycan-binding protein [Pseudotabrizicola sp.]